MNKAMGNISFDILLVEDNMADILLLQEALEDIDLDLRLHVVNNGEDAMDYLQQVESYKAAARPDLILLDLNLPKKNGFAVLEEIKQDAKLKHIPVIILSTSKAREDINRCYRLQANCYITKPLELDAFMVTIQRIADFWLQTVKLPESGK